MFLTCRHKIRFISLEVVVLREDHGEGGGDGVGSTVTALTVPCVDTAQVKHSLLYLDPKDAVFFTLPRHLNKTITDAECPKDQPEAFDTRHKSYDCMTD